MIKLTVEFVREWAEKYRLTHTKELALETQLKTELLDQDHLTAQQLLRIAQWKAPRIQGHIRTNSDEDIHDISRIAFTTTHSERVRIEVLHILSGVSWPMASTILHFRYPENYTVLDFRALWTLGIPLPSQYDFGFWSKYNQHVYHEAQRLQVPLRDLDMALWMYSKAEQKVASTQIEENPPTPRSDGIADALLDALDEPDNLCEGPNTSTVLKKSFCIDQWKNWDHEINAAVQAFRNTFSCNPNILLANRVTFQRIDMVADKEHLKNAHGDSPASPAQYCRLGCFKGSGYKLWFCVDDTLDDRCCLLVYDNDPDGAGEPIPEESAKTLANALCA